MHDKMHKQARSLSNALVGGHGPRFRAPVGRSKTLDYVKKCICGRPIHDAEKKCSICRRLSRVFVGPHMVAGHYRRLR